MKILTDINRSVEHSTHKFETQYPKKHNIFLLLNQSHPTFTILSSAIIPHCNNLGYVVHTPIGTHGVLMQYFMSVWIIVGLVCSPKPHEKS